ncbi:MAG: acetyl-CoA C-acetyltransferase [Spirochaetota bacterium]
MERVAVVAAKRTAIGTFAGMFTDFSAVKLGIEALKAALKDAGIEPDKVDEVIVGNVLGAGLGQNIARQISIGAGLPVEVPAYIVNKLCASGLKSICLGAAAIMLGEAEIVAAGGTENMSQVPYAVMNARFGIKMGNTEFKDLLLNDGLYDAFNNCHMGVTAENLAEKWGITRERMDFFALQSQTKAQRAMESGRFKDEIVPLTIPRKKGEAIVLDTDEHPRKNVTRESLAKLQPAFKKDGTVTPGNSSGINDGAAFVILVQEEKARLLGLEPLGFIKAYASTGVEPAYMGFGPVPATKNTLKKSGWKLREVELVELNEAFAAQSLAVLEGFNQELGGINPEILNVNGGAIALGHPIGASGTRILVTLLHEMKKRNAKKGLATLCIGGGQGLALLIER